MIIICIDEPLDSNPTCLQINIEHWTTNDQGNATKVWSGDWTQATPDMYTIPLDKLFDPLAVPDMYEGSLDVEFSPARLRYFRERVAQDWPY